MKRPEPIPVGGSVPFPDISFKTLHPNLAEFIHDAAYEDGSPRELGSIAIKSQDGGVLAVANDPDNKRSLYCMGSSVSKALKALDTLMGSQTADWRAWGGPKKKK